MNIVRTTSFILRNAIGDELTLSESELADLPRQCSVVNPPKIGDTIKDEPSAPWMIFALTGKKIDAIKLLREKRGLGLKEAKDAVEGFIAKLTQIENNVVETAKDTPTKNSYVSPDYDDRNWRGPDDAPF